MLTNPIFLVFVASVLAGAVMTWRVLARPAARTREGPVPGYSITPGRELDLNPEAHPLAAEKWEAIALETFHSGDRSRLIITLRVDEPEPDAIEALFRSVAHEVQVRTHAQVVLVETDARSGAEVHLLYAPDGRGWAGHDVGVELVSKPRAAR